MGIKGSLLVLVLLWQTVISEIVSQPLIGQHEEHVSIQSVEIGNIDNGGRSVTIDFDATDPFQILWEVDGKPVMNYDSNFVTTSNYNSATLLMTSENADKMVNFHIVQRVYQESVLIRMSGTPSGRFSVSEHTLSVSQAEGMTYTNDSINDVNVEALLWVDDVARYKYLRIRGMLVIPDYCSRPVKPIFGFSSDMLDMTSMEDSEISSDYSIAKRIHITSVSRPSLQQGILVVDSDFDARLPDDPIRNIHTVRRIFFKPAWFNQDFIISNTVTFIGWNSDLVVNQNEDVDFHVYAIGNPVPRIMLAKNGRDISTQVERRDIEEAYFKHAIFRFRNVTSENSGRYICTAASGDGRIKETFTLYVRTPCSANQ